jgi:hypothetical protein
MRTPSRNRRNRFAALFEACEKRQHMAVDLVVSSISSDVGLQPAPNGTITLTVGITNIGTTAVPPMTMFAVGIYSVENLYEPATYQTSGGIFGLGVYETKVLTFQVNAPQTVDNTAYLFADVDHQHIIAESNEANNNYRGLGMDMLKYSSEADVTSPAGTWNPRSLSLNGYFVDGVLGDELIGNKDIDTYKVTLEAGKRYWFEMYEVNNAFDGAMRLYGQNFWPLATSTGDIVHNGRGAYIEFTPATTGEYHLAVAAQVNINAPINNLDSRVAGGVGSFKLAAAEMDPFTVYITSSDYAATEGEGESALKGLEITVRREWGNQWGRPLTVNLEYAGQFSNDLTDAIPTTLTIQPDQSFATFRTTAVDDGINEMTESATVSIGYSNNYITHSQYNSQQLMVFDNPATHHPFALGSGYIGGDRSGPRTYINFSEDVGYSISRDDYVLKNVDTNAIIPASKYEVLWSPTINGSIVYFTGFENGQLPDGNYRMTLRKNSVYTWPQNQQLANDENIDFFSLRGDTNGDRKVDFADLLTLAQNYGKDLGYEGGAWKGDFDRDGKVEFDDLLTLAQNYGHSVASPLPAARGRSKREGLFGGEAAIV